MIDFKAALNAAQYEAATCGDGPVLVAAGAGSGKTRTIVYRLAWLAEQGVDPASMLLLTFTRKAAKEMLHRAGILLDGGLSGVQGGTFHAFAFSVLRRRHPARLEGRPLSVMDGADITAAVRSCKEELKIGGGDRSFPRTQTVVGLLSKARNKERPLGDILQREAAHLLPYADDLTRLGDAYAAWRNDRGLLDYDDLLFELEALLRDDRDAAGWLRSRFHHILVDEYQDTNRVQARIVRLLAGPADAPPAANVMAVGDEAQSIYAFRGATVRNILDFPNLFPNARVIRLEENYRSFRPILDVANGVLARAAETLRKRLFTRRDGGAPVRLVTPLSDRSQAILAARRVEDLLDRHPPQEIAVLFRSGYHSFHLEMELNRRGIRFRKYGGLRYSEAAHVKDAAAFARLALNPLDFLSFSRVAAHHPGIGPRTAAKIHAAIAAGDSRAMGKALARHAGLKEDLDFVDGLRSGDLSPAAVFSLIVERCRPRMERTWPDDWPRRLQALEEIVGMASAYGDLELFLADLALDVPEEDDSPQDDAITLSTIHSAKGLEWNAVLVIDLAEDRFPSRRALIQPEEFEEERRLMYVACTRARQELELYCPAVLCSRTGDGGAPAAQSPFVRELPPDLLETWVEGYDGSLRRRGSSAPSFSASAPAPGPARMAAPVRSGPAMPAAPDSAPAGGGIAPGTRCRHKIFGRGRIVGHIPPDRVRVDFPGLGTKIILMEYVTLED